MRVLGVGHKGAPPLVKWARGLKITPGKTQPPVSPFSKGDLKGITLYTTKFVNLHDYVL